MLVSFVRFIKGSVDFTAYGKFPERFINLTARNGVNIWNAHPVDGGLSASMGVYDYKKIRTIARKSKVKIKIDEKHGLPFILNKYKPRVGLIAGTAAGIVLLIVLSNFVWSVSITGTTRVSEEYLRRVLEQKGVYVGAYKNNLNVESIERNTSLEISDIGWMSVNLTGTIASIEVKEKAEKPKLDTSSAPCNIKAAKDGVITKIKSKCGVTQVLKGSGVAQGDLLVSGIVETKMDTIQYVHAKAEVFADVISKKEISLPKEQIYYSLSENTTDRYRYSMLWLNFPSSLSFDTFDNGVNTYSTQSFYGNSVVLPMSLYKQTTHELVPQNISLGRKQADSIVMNEAVLYEAFNNSKSTLVSRKINTKQSKDGYVCTIDYVFNENIAQSVDFKVTQ